MFQDAHLWEAGILLIGVAFVIGAIYLAMTLKSLSRTIDDVDRIIVDNRKSIQSIVGEVNEIVDNASKVTDDVKQTVEVVKNIILTVEEGVKMAKGRVLSPVLKGVKIAQAGMKIINKKKNKNAQI
ncbi:MAG TPA: hypothetical protein DHN33_07675 [Eubacteriaceae bacterium]|nr:hypothetical protein [Eubacteriaceae bacterium]